MHLSDDNRLNYKDFRSTVISGLSAICGDEITIEENKVLKNNSVELYGINIKGKGENISPTIYLESFYDDYFEGRKSIEEIQNILIKAYAMNKVKKDFDTESFMHFEMIRHKIAYRLINKCKNKKLLEQVPHFEFLDLAIVFLVKLEEIGGNILIRNEHLSLWKINEEKLFECAKDNSEKYYEPVLQGMDECVREMVMNRGEEDTGKIPQVGAGVYILSNKEKYHGASCIIDRSVLYDISESMKSGYYILPSSIHELILITDKMVGDSRGLKSMVADANKVAVEPEDYLSDNVYYYDHRSKELSIVK